MLLWGPLHSVAMRMSSKLIVSSMQVSVGCGGLFVPADRAAAMAAMSNLCWLLGRVPSNSVVLTCFFIVHIYGIERWWIFITKDSGCHSLIKRRLDRLTTVISICGVKELWKSKQGFFCIISVFTENLTFRKWFCNSQGEQQHHASVRGEKDQMGFV